MSQSKRSVSVRKRIWRMSADAPFGAFIDDDAVRIVRSSSADELDRGWAMSTLELTRGLDVYEEDSAASAALFATLFKPATS